MLISLCDFQVDGIIALNSLKPNLEYKTGYCGPQRPPKGTRNPLVSVYVCRQPPAFRNHKSQSYEIRNFYDRYEYTKLLVEIGTPDVDIQMKDFFVFCDFLKNGSYDFFSKQVNLSSVITYQWCIHFYSIEIKEDGVNQECRKINILIVYISYTASRKALDLKLKLS